MTGSAGDDQHRRFQQVLVGEPSVEDTIGILRVAGPSSYAVRPGAAWPDELPRIEAALFLVIALAFVWLRPTRASSEAS